MGMLGSPGLDHMSNGGSDLKYGNAECYSPKYDHRDYKGKNIQIYSNLLLHEWHLTYKNIC